jgi:DNA-binding PadR family transcriptional regulator
VNQIPVLDAFVLSLLDRGAQSAYDLHRRAGISLGASTPALARLAKQKFVVREKSTSAGKRIRYEFRLTAIGLKIARRAWSELLGNENRAFDLDSTLRIVDMAAHYGARRDALHRFLRRAGSERLKLANQATSQSREVTAKLALSYLALKARCDADRLRSEAEVLLAAAESFKRRRDPIEGQRPLL